MGHPPNNLGPVGSTAKAFVPALPEVEMIGPRTARLKRTPQVQWRGRWYEVLLPFEFDGATRPWWSGWAMPKPFDVRWLTGACFHDASWCGRLLEVCVRDMVAGPQDTDQRLPIWLPPALADRMFHELNAATGLNWLQNRLALRAVTVYHRTVGRKRYVTKKAWNVLHSDMPWTHARCLNYENQSFQSCDDVCDGFYGDATQTGART